MAQQIQLRRDTAANWASADPILAEGEIAYDLTNGIIKVGNGITVYSLLPEISGGGGGGNVTSVNGEIGIVVLNADDIDDSTTLNKFATSAELSKLAAIEPGADVTDTANVTAAGALMDTEVDADLKTLSLPANTTISTYGASLINDTSASVARTTLGLGTLAVKSTSRRYEVITFPASVLQGHVSSAWHVPPGVSGTLISVDIWCDTAPTIQSVIVDMNKNDTTSVWNITSANRPTIATTTKYDNSGTPDVTSMTAGDQFQLEVVQYNAGDDIGQLICRVIWDEVIA